MKGNANFYEVKYKAYGLGVHESVFYTHKIIMAYRVINEWNKKSSHMKGRPYLYVLKSYKPDINILYNTLQYYEEGPVQYYRTKQTLK